MKTKESGRHRGACLSIGYILGGPHDGTMQMLVEFRCLLIVSSISLGLATRFSSFYAPGSLEFGQSSWLCFGHD